MTVPIASARRGILLVVGAMLVSGMVLLGLYSTAGAQSAVAVSLQPSGATLFLPDGTVAVDVLVADGVQDLYGAQMELSFDPAVVLVVDADGLEWGSAGKVPGGIIRRDGSFEHFGAHGPPLGMMGGFQYNVQRFPMGAGDVAFVLSHGSQGLFLGAADLLAELHGNLRAKS